MKSRLLLPAIPLLLLVGSLFLALLFGGPGEPPPMASINDPFKSVDFSDLPAIGRFPARDGTALAFRAYPAMGLPKGSVVLVHGSSASSASMHVLAKAMAKAGYMAFALDIRGHGDSGRKGSIAYVGQLEDDLEDFLGSVKPALPRTLAGFSSGGGFVLRFAGSARQDLFSNYLLLSPFLGPDAPNYRPGAGGWVKVGVPRIVAISLLNAVGVRAFNGLPVARFALSKEAKAFLTSQYSYSLAQNFQPRKDYKANIRAMGRPFRVVAGKDDEVFLTDRLGAIFEAGGRSVPVTLVPGVGHVSLTLEPSAVQAAVAAVGSLDEPKG